MPEKQEPDVTSPSIHDNQTWNSCPECHKGWADPVPTPGLIHRTRLCAQCKMKEEYGKK